MTQQPDDNDDDFESLGLDTPETALLHGKLANVRPFIDALSCIYSPQHKAQDVSITIHSDGGLRFTAQHAGCLQAAVIVPSAVFTSFRAPDPTLRLRLNLSLLMESLSLFGSGAAPASAVLAHAEPGGPLALRLWDGAVDTVCRLATLASDGSDDPDFGFFAHHVVTTAVLDSDVVRDALSELDYAGATTAEVRVAPTAPCFVLASPAATVGTELDGSGGDALCTIELPDPGDRTADAFQSFSCRRAQCGVYKLEHLQRCRNGLAASESCKVQMNDYGMLSIVCKMKAGSDAERGGGRGGGMERCFVEFVVVAQEIDDDEEEEEGEEERVGTSRRQRRVAGEEDDEDDDEEDATQEPTYY